MVVTGLSGSGKSTAIKAFEDIGYLCIDNLPVPLLPALLDLCEGEMPDTRKVALGIDIRERTFLKAYEKIFKEIQEKGYNLEILFFEASVDVLQRRYSQTRRIHPLELWDGYKTDRSENSGEHGGIRRSLLEAINRERELLKPLRDRATKVIDTSELTVHALKQMITTTYRLVREEEAMTVQVLSFGFKYGVPHDADMVLDVRFLPNPFFVESLRPLTGCNPEVQTWVFSHDDTQDFIRLVESLLEFLVPRYLKEGRRYFTIAFGCTGGKHRSVVMAEHFSSWFRNRGFYTLTFHRDAGNE
ncbi:UPF0042 nucleotide-binding protein [Thermodesulforhabdus norvegica]|uniref:UPF0042 nucleotide-binding protein n=1 Tax=Thermodesulforhabdus norvegica TaxID=39841 RepID=A0A1I4VJI7_9BACT|nr:UPF0042 nucleotide-binding protein [Thermodesulforhabdus norvegica]